VSKHRDRPYRGGRQKHWIKERSRLASVRAGSIAAGCGTVSTNAYITGIAIAILAIAALAAFAVWEEWLNLIVGLWALVSPWVLGFQGTTAMTVHVIIGAAVAILAAIELDDAPDPTAADHRPLRG
jgi:hypothetical protein